MVTELHGASFFGKNKNAEQIWCPRHQWSWFLKYFKIILLCLKKSYNLFNDT
jgi:hypothetical protein